jgi:hypothetical protein
MWVNGLNFFGVNTACSFPKLNRNLNGVLNRHFYSRFRQIRRWSLREAAGDCIFLAAYPSDKPGMEV